MYHAVITNVSYGHYVQKVECANHAVKCYRNRLEALCKEHPEYRGRYGLSDDTPTQKAGSRDQHADGHIYHLKDFYR